MLNGEYNVQRWTAAPITSTALSCGRCYGWRPLMTTLNQSLTRFHFLLQVTLMRQLSTSFHRLSHLFRLWSDHHKQPQLLLPLPPKWLLLPLLVSTQWLWIRGLLVLCNSRGLWGLEVRCRLVKVSLADISCNTCYLTFHFLLFLLVSVAFSLVNYTVDTVDQPKQNLEENAKICKHTHKCNQSSTAAVSSPHSVMYVQ